MGPLIDEIGRTFNLSESLLGLLTTLPLIAFGVISTVTPYFTKRFGLGQTLLWSMVLLTAGIVIRSLEGVFFLYLGTTILGIAIAFGNVLIPAITKNNFPNKAGLVTSLHSATMSFGAALAAGLSVPLARDLNLGWEGSLITWAILSFIAIFIWIPQIKKIKNTTTTRSLKVAMRKLSGSRLVWQIAIYMGLQSLAFYVILAWLPSILLDYGYNEEFGGWMLSLSQASGILGALAIPVWAASQKDQRSVITLLIVVEVISFIGLMFPHSFPVYIWIASLGFVLGGTFGLALLLIVLRAPDSETAAELSGIVQSIGYFLAAIGPFIIGLIQDLSNNWKYSLGFLILVSCYKLVAGLQAGKAQKV
ncbi:MAG: MFS transporter [Aequorivita sp.]|nr:MFS transporter [Aequorivita sp.]